MDWWIDVNDNANKFLLFDDLVMVGSLSTPLRWWQIAVHQMLSPIPEKPLKFSNDLMA